MLLRRHKTLLVYLLSALFIFGLATSIFHVKSNQESTEAGLNEKLSQLRQSLFNDDQKKGNKVEDSSKVVDSENKIDKSIENVVEGEDSSKISLDSLENLSKLSDEEIKEQLKAINERQKESLASKEVEVEYTVESFRIHEDRVEGTKIDNPDRIRNDIPPDGKPWTKYEIDRVVPKNLEEINSVERENATLFTLCRNSEIWEILDSIQQLETRFNHKHHYDWVFLNDEPFSEEFINLTSNMVSGRARYGLIPRAHWSYPSHIDEAKAKQIRESRKWAAITYGNSESYRHMCRFNSLFFYKHPIMQEYKYYWRVEPHVGYHCDILTDPFKFLKDNGKKYGFTISMKELPSTIETLWETSKLYFKQLSHDYFNQETNNNLLKFISNDNGETYNLCHYWTNFEIADLDIYRNEIYEGYVNFLDQAGGFFYERWGDAPIHSIIFSIILKKGEIHLFDDISYEHTVASTCPLSAEFRKKAKCTCNPNDIWVIKSDSSCNLKFWDVGFNEHPPELSAYLKKIHDEKVEQEELRAAQRKLRVETARRQSELRRKKAEERRKERLELKKLKQQKKKNAKQ
ncbi:hypothetical protein CANINC_003926 [Pichia inconspicua]|uniref:Glycosyltransferase family 15 protein n=1 Tax=Pichia inconspicua TaxID=52247 RepID=A0A4T0WXG8_9ASCO|nr:hypothetical protein CANINC_003926 [[Candida] inconspicua]